MEDGQPRTRTKPHPCHPWLILDSAVEAGQRIHKPLTDTDTHGFLTGSFFLPPGESAIFCKPVASVFIRVHPWLCCTAVSRLIGSSTPKHAKPTKGRLKATSTG